MNRFLLDTNAVIALLGGNNQLNDTLTDAKWVGISIITKLEFLSFPGITKADVDLFSAFESRVEVIDITNAQMGLLKDVVRLKKTARIKLPDAIIVASAIANKALLITADMLLLNQCPEQTQKLLPSDD